MTISLPINIFIVCVRHNYNQRNNEVIYQKTYRYGNGGLEGRGEDDEDTINMCPEILVEPLSNCSKLTYVRHEHAWEQFCLQNPTFHTKIIGCIYGLVELNKLTRSFLYSTPFQKASHEFILF